MANGIWPPQPWDPWPPIDYPGRPIGPGDSILPPNGDGGGRPRPPRLPAPPYTWWPTPSNGLAPYMPQYAPTGAMPYGWPYAVVGRPPRKKKKKRATARPKPKKKKAKAKARPRARPPPAAPEGIKTGRIFALASNDAAVDMKNGLAYAAGIANPAIPGLRIPDNSAMPSLTTQFVSRLVVPVRTGAVSTSQYFCGAMIYPNLKTFSQTIASGDGYNANVAYTSADHPDYTAFNGVAMLYRMVSVGFRVVDSGTLTGRGMTMYCGNLHTNYIALGMSAPLTTLAEVKTVRLMDSAEAGNDCNVTWFPLIGSEVLIANGAGTLTTSGTTWRPVSQTTANFVDNAIVLFGYANTVAPSDNVTLEVFVNVEWTPLLADLFLGTPMKVEGSGSAVEGALVKLGDSTNPTGIMPDSFGFTTAARKRKGGGTGEYRDEFDAGVNSVWQTLAPWINAASAVYQIGRFLSTAIGGAAMLFGAKADKAVRFHRFALIMDRESLSPFRMDKDSALALLEMSQAEYAALFAGDTKDDVESESGHVVVARSQKPPGLVVSAGPAAAAVPAAMTPLSFRDGMPGRKPG